MTKTFRGLRGSDRPACGVGVVAVSLALLVVVALGAVPAVSVASKGVVETFGSDDLRQGAGVAVNQASGDVYVADSGDDGQRIAQFTGDGEFIRAWGWGVATGADAFETCTATCQPGIRGSGEGQFSFQTLDPDLFRFTPPQVAVDQGDGAVYVADTLNNRVQKFSADGQYLAQFGGSGNGDGQLALPEGVAVDPVSQDVYVADTGNDRVQRFTPAGAFVAQIGAAGAGDGEFSLPRRMAVDSSGRLYVLEVGNARVQRFDATGAFESVFGAGAVNLCLLLSDIAIDPATGHALVAGCNASMAMGIVEVDDTGQLVDTHPLPTGFNVGGLDVKASSGQIYASDMFGSLAQPTAVAVLDVVTPPTVSIAPVTGVTAEGFTAHATINPQGLPDARYQVEYSTDGATWTAGSALTLVGSGTDPVDVERAVTGLAANTEYQVRIVVEKDFDAATTTSDVVLVTTETAPPAVRPVAAGTRSATAAWLGGEVNPRNSASTAFIEYTRASEPYEAGSRVPLPPDSVDVGAGNEYVGISQLATGLAPGTDYRFRVVATNVAGTTVGPERTFTTRRLAPAAPDGRAYEMVSPLDKNGGSADRDFLPQAVLSGAAPDGDAVAFGAQAQFAGIPSGAPGGQYLSVRNDSGWTTSGINPRVEPSAGSDAVGSSIPYTSADLMKAVVTTNASLTPGAAEQLGGSSGLYLQDNRVPGGGNHTLLSDPFEPLPQQQLPPLLSADRFEFSAATDDLEYIVFESVGRRLLPDGLAPDTGKDVYVWHDGALALVSKLPSGDPVSWGEGGAGHTSGQTFPGHHVVSEDGQRIYFQEAGTLYVREHGTTTSVVSDDERAGENPVNPPAGQFQAAKADDGSLALFTSLLRLTDDAKACDFSCPNGFAADLYLWDATAPPDHRLTDLTTADPDGGGVLGVVGAADDMSRAYFVAIGALATGAEDGRPNLYEWSQAGGIRLVATLASFATPGDPLSSPDVPVWSNYRVEPAIRYRDARIAPDGDQLLFTSHARLTPDGAEGSKQVYLYDAGPNRLTCVSCPASTIESPGAAWLFITPELGNNRPFAPQRLPRNLSADGKRAFFETENALVPADSNGKADVYQWEDGEVSLVTSGESAEGAKFIDASADGRDVFFTTRERLVGADVDNQVDVYDARADGGFPEQELPPPCVGDLCQGAVAMPPALASPGSSEGAGDLPASRRPAFVARRLTAAQARALARGRAAVLSVRVNRAGRVVVKGVARSGGRSRTVISASGRARRAGALRVRLRLSKAGRAALAASGRLRVELRVRFAGAVEQRTSIALQRPALRKGR